MAYRGRFAPSPTGDLHFGGARTALAAWLAARAAGGSYLVRVEDLDAPRIIPGAEARILEDLAWLGLVADEGPDVGGPHAPYQQSRRLLSYDNAVEQLLAAGRAFRCWCSRAEVARAAAAPHGPGDDGPRYPGTCRERTERPPGENHIGRRPSVRLRVESELVTFDDGVHGARGEDVSTTVGDFVIRRADGIPAYQLAVVIDDAAMGISDIVRGDDLLGSTARQLLLYRALGLTAPRFAHVPLVLGPDGTRLSKRHGAIGVRALRERGWPAARVVGMLASTLGLCPPGGERMPADLVAGFTLARITRAPTTFDPAAFL
jgi:glutamyl-tRNA synthetase